MKVFKIEDVCIWVAAESLVAVSVSQLLTYRYFMVLLLINYLMEAIRQGESVVLKA